MSETRNTSSVTMAGFRVGVPGPDPGSFTPAPRRGRWTACPTCDATHNSCPTCDGSGVVLIPPERPPEPKAPVAVTRRAEAKTAARKVDPEVTAKLVETIEPGQLVRWSKADLLDPDEADDEDRWWPVPEGTWREVNGVPWVDTKDGDQVLVVEYAGSRYSEGDYDERTYRPGAVLQTKPPKFRTHKIGGTLKVGDRIRVGGEEWIVHADWLEQR